MQTFKKTQFIVDALRYVADGGSPADLVPNGDSYGVCYFLEKLTDSIWTDIPAECAEDYAEFSGSVSYPIKAPVRSLIYTDAEHAQCAFDTACTSSDFWGGEYGDSRRDYAEHVADWIEENLL